MKGIDRQRVERVARLYASSKDASQALGILLGSFGRICRRYGIESPHARRRRRLQEGRNLRKEGDHAGSR
jgi:transposase-like protein